MNDARNAEPDDEPKDGTEDATATSEANQADTGVESEENAELFAVDGDGEIVGIEIVETEVFAVDGSGDVVDVSTTVELIEETPWHMPAETAPQERIWMAFPPADAYLGETADDLDAARSAWTEVAHNILRFEPVAMVVDPHDVAVARRYLSTEVDIVTAPLDDAWMRDIGPTFVRDENGRLGAVTWRFNGWGGREGARWGNDSVIGAVVAARAGARRVVSELVNEGGGIQVDGLGTVLLTESVQLDPGRNPGASKADVEAECARTLGTTNPIWLKRGLYRDEQRFGTRGHADLVAAFPAPGRVLVHTQTDDTHPDHAVSREIVDALRAAATPDGDAWDIVQLPAPQVIRDADDFVGYSYVNHLVVNDAVIACTFDDPHDDHALDILAEAYPDREIVGADARAIFAHGGGIHRITQQQPTAR